MNKIAIFLFLPICVGVINGADALGEKEDPITFKVNLTMANFHKLILPKILPLQQRFNRILKKRPGAAVTTVQPAQQGPAKDVHISAIDVHTAFSRHMKAIGTIRALESIAHLYDNLYAEKTEAIQEPALSAEDKAAYLIRLANDVTNQLDIIQRELYEAENSGKIVRPVVQLPELEIVQRPHGGHRVQPKRR